MNEKIISEDKLLELKELAKEIEYLEFCITTGKRDDHTLLKHRVKTELLTTLILEL